MPLTYLLLALLWQQTPRLASVAGTVTDSVTGAPVRKAHVTLTYGASTYSATSDAAGRFIISNVTPGTYAAGAEHAGYQPGRQRDLLRLAEDQHLDDLKIQITPLGAIAGRVLDAEGQPMVRISVQAMMENYGITGRHMATAGMTMTDDRGEYRIFDLPAGRYYLLASDLSVSGLSGHLRDDQVTTRYVPTWLPGVSDVSQAAPTVLGAGAQLSGIEIRLRQSLVYHVRGKLSGPSEPGSPPPIWLTACDTASSNNGGLYASVLRDGTFDASGVPPGNWCLSVTEAFENAHASYARQKVIVTDRDVENVTLTVLPMVQIRGQVQIDGEASTKVPLTPVRLEPLESSVRGGGSNGMHPDGTFTIANVEPGPYRVTGLTGLGMYLKTVRFNNEDMPGNRILVPSSDSQLTLLFSTDCGELSGVVRTASGEPAAGVYISAVASPSRGDTPPGAMTRSDGGFQMRCLAPGDYQVSAWETRDLGLIEYPEFRKPFESRSVPVSIPSKGHETVSLTPIAAAEIEAAKARLR